MTRADEQQVIFAGGVHELHGILYPGTGDSARGVVICNPLFEERKSAHRVLVETARALQSSGHAVLRFDYRGCGNSAGDFREFGVADWLTDIQSATGYLRAHGACASVGLLGLRLGASFACMAASPTGADFLACWEPVIDGAAYLRQELRKKLMKQMVTYGESRDSRDELTDAAERGEDIDFDGYALSPRLHGELNELDLTATELEAALPILLSAVTHNARPSKAMEEWADGLREELTNMTIHGCRLPPFWNLVGLADGTELISETVTWLTQQKNTSTS